MKVFALWLTAREHTQCSDAFPDVLEHGGGHRGGGRVRHPANALLLR